MTNKTILDAMHETAKGLHKAGAMDATTMREFDALCLPPVKHYSAGQIKKLRLRYKASQALFAAYLNTSPSTVQKWEQGKKTTERPIAEAAQYRRSERFRCAWLTRASKLIVTAIVRENVGCRRPNVLVVTWWEYFQPYSFHTPICTPTAMFLGNVCPWLGAGCRRVAASDLAKQMGVRLRW